MMITIKKQAARSLFALSLIGLTMSIAPLARAQVRGVSKSQSNQVRLATSDQLDSASLERFNKMSVKQRETELKKLSPRARGRIRKYLWCRFGPQGGSRADCAGG